MWRSAAYSGTQGRPTTCGGGGELTEQSCPHEMPNMHVRARDHSLASSPNHGRREVVAQSCPVQFPADYQDVRSAGEAKGMCRSVARKG